MSVTYFVALPFVQSEEGIAPGQAQELPNEHSAIIKAEALSRKPENVGALAFKRTGDPNMGNFGDAIVLRTFGKVPDNLDEFESALLTFPETVTTGGGVEELGQALPRERPGSNAGPLFGNCSQRE